MKKNNLVVGSPVIVHAYKADGTLYREWKNVFVVEHTDEFLVLANDHSIITEQNNVRKKTNNVALWYFIKDEWFNIMCLPKKGGKIKFYSNLASPFIIEENTIKYIDYDLDFKVNENRNFKIVDVDEYEENSKKYNYSEKLTKKIDEAVLKIKDLVKKNDKLFSVEYASKVYQKYINEIRKEGQEDGQEKN